jgi:hypothetical protein
MIEVSGWLVLGGLVLMFACGYVVAASRAALRAMGESEKHMGEIRGLWKIIDDQRHEIEGHQKAGTMDGGA